MLLSMDINSQDVMDEMKTRFPTEWTVCLQAAQIKELNRVNQEIAEAYVELESRCLAAEATLAERNREDIQMAMSTPEEHAKTISWEVPEDGEAWTPGVIPFPSPNETSDDDSEG